jgi:hypothetical protein
MRGNTEQTKKVYFSIVGGRFAERVTENTPNAIKRHSAKANDGNGADVWEIQNDYLSGYIKSLQIEADDKYGKRLKVLMTDTLEEYIINIPLDSKYFDHFCLKIKNADLTKEIKLSPYSFEDKKTGKKVVGMNLFQGTNLDKKIDYYFTKEQTHGKPMPTENMDDEDYKVYKIQERKFFSKMIEAIKIEAPQIQETISKQESESDDLPF